MARKPKIVAERRRGYSYRRVSDPKQRKGDGMRRQGNYAERLCQKNGWALDDTLVLDDKGRSAFHGQHLKPMAALGGFLRW